MPDTVIATEPSNRNGYRSFQLGKFELARDEYFVTVHWPAKGARRSHQMPADAFLCACMRDVAWNFFYGWVNFDHVIGTRNHYGKVDFYAGTFNGTLKEAGVDYLEQFDADHIMATFKAILRDWVNEGFDPFAAPVETGSAFGRKQGDNNTGAPRARVTIKAGDVAAMPADIRHQGYSTKRSMLYVWENVTPGLPQRYETGELSPYPVDF